MFGEIHFPFIFLVFFFDFSSGTGNLHSNPSQASSPGQRQVTLRIYPVVVPSYAQYPKQNFLYAGYPYGVIDPLQGNLLPDYFQRGNIYQGSLIPYQHGNFLENLPTRIIDVDERGNIKTPNRDPIFSMRQENSKSLPSTETQASQIVS
ncbi:uncharacterized protein LOC123310607 [Coccinella septempunctata]|uniref:uncharacterized protein LOC123310607 n=1 Tax=Coccinella septempunctata TaxID=41139 RepID=UPI001D06E068|nr:uncharacterized protein LOC123310607 [Coccinella septempunctata]